MFQVCFSRIVSTALILSCSGRCSLFPLKCRKLESCPRFNTRKCMETYAARYNDYVGERCLALIWLRLVHFGQDQTMPTQWKPQSSGDFTIVPEGNFFAEHCALVRSGNQSRCCCLDTALAIPADSPGPMHQPQRSGHGVPHSTPFTFVYHHSKMTKKRSNCYGSCGMLWVVVIPVGAGPIER